LSTDFQLAHECPHLIQEEPVVLGTDRRALNTRSPVGATNTVRILANNSFYLPMGGLLSFAQITGAIAGPFNIAGCDENTVTVTGSEETRTFTLPIGLRVPADQIVTQMNQELGTIFVENVGGYLIFTDLSKAGPRSRIKVTGGAAEALGFGLQSGAKGKEVFPPWRLEKRDDDIRNLYPRFLKQVAQNASFKVTYTVPVQRCLRCRGTFVENDYRFDLIGEPIRIQDEDLLYQAALKILLTGKGSNPFHPFYGSNIKSRIGTKAVGAIVTQLNEDVRTALINMQKLQAGQARFQKITAKERLFQILSIEVLEHTHDPTAFLLDVVVSNASGDPINLSIVFTVPGAVALAGSNGLSLGLDLTGLSSNELRQFFSSGRR